MKIEFGTDGVRGPVGESLLSLAWLPILGRAVGRWLVEKYGAGVGIIIGCDTRQSGDFVASALKAGLLLYPVRVYSAGVLPTPAITIKAHHEQQYQCAIMISASHNVYSDNGIKIIDVVSGKLSEHDESVLKRYMHEEQHTTIDYSRFGTEQQITGAAAWYQEYILEQFPAHFLQGKTIVLDCAHGATYEVAPRIFASLGARVIPLAVAPNGKNINHECGSLHPAMLQKNVLKQGADMGIAFDGDGDRVTMVTRHGVIKDGDDILSVLMQHKRYAQEPEIVGTIMSNYGLQLHVAAQKKALVRTPVGDKYVAQHLEQKGYLLGGEPSGHIIMADHFFAGDGIMASLRALEVLTHTHNEEMVTFSKCPQFMINMPVTERYDLTSEPFCSILAHYTALIANAGRLVVRYSGTEKVLRIMTEDQVAERAQLMAQHVATSLQKAFTTYKKGNHARIIQAGIESYI